MSSKKDSKNPLISAKNQQYLKGSGCCVDGVTCPELEKCRYLIKNVDQIIS